jgi:sulfatase modifying factor 1
MARANFLAVPLSEIPAGEFCMGSENGGANEAPVHRVWVDGFAMARYPVSRREYVLFVEATGHQPPRYWEAPEFQHPDQPVAGPSWNDAVAYCEWLGALSGKPYRLPSEAEREKAARGTLENCDYPWGDELPLDHQGGRETLLDAAGTEGPNSYGLYDMSAGVHEWCADYYSPSYYSDSPYRNPQGPEIGVRRVARGGSWRHAVRFGRCAARSSLPPDKQFSDFGFRCALMLD